MKSDAVARIAAQLRRTATTLERDAVAAFRAARNLEAGYPESTIGTGTTGGGGPSDPTARAAITASAQQHAADELRVALVTLHRDAVTASARVERLLGVDPRNTDTAAHRDTCVNCGHLFTRVASDRPRAGRCVPCYRYRSRHAGADRPLDDDLEDAS